MKYMQKIVFLWNIFGHSIGWYNVSTEQTLYDNVPCKLAQPKIEQKKEGIIVTALTGINTDDELWVNYVEGLAAFDYTGCIAEYSLHNARPSDMANEGPGYCYSICKSTFGIRKDKCFCLQSSLDLIYKTEPYCTDICGSETYTVCGGKHRRASYLSLYSFLDIGGYTTDVENYCRCFEPTNHELSWKECSISYRAMCVNGLQVTPQAKFCSWTECAQYCFNLSYLPTTNNNSNLVKANGSQLWTGTLRSRIIRSLTGKTNRINEIPGYIKKGHNDMFYLSFTQDNIKRRALCEEDTSHLTLPQTTTTTTSLTTFLTTETTSFIVFNITESTISSKAATTVSSGSKETNNNQAVTIGAAVGVTIVVVIISTIIVVVICLKRKKMASPTKTSNRQNGTIKRVVSLLNNYDVISDITTNNQSCREHGVIKVDDYAHGNPKTVHEDIDTNHCKGYNDGEQRRCKEDRSNGDSDDAHDKAYDHTYYVLENHMKATVLEDGIYNVTDAKHGSLPTSSDNIYNKLDEKSNVTYDNIENHRPRCGSQNRTLENTYDTKETVLNMRQKHEDGENVYNKVSDFEQNEIEADTYNHVFKTYLKTSNKSTDNSDV